MKDVMDEVVYRTTEEGNQVILTRYLPDHAHAPKGSL